MSNNADYRLYLEECMKGIRAEIRAGFDNVHIELSAIKEQTTKTNSRVTHLENQRDEYVKTRVDTQMLGEVSKKVDKINSDLLEYRFFKKYPKILVGVIVVMVIGMLVGFGLIKSGQDGLKREVDLINSPVTTRSGTIEWWPSGIVIDSIKANTDKR